MNNSTQTRTTGLLTLFVKGWGIAISVTALFCLMAGLLVLQGCYPGAPNSRVPGKYLIERNGFSATLDVHKDGTFHQEQIDPGGHLLVADGKWHFTPGEAYPVWFDDVLPGYVEAGQDASKRTFWTPEIDIVWGRVCLLRDGNKDIFYCKV